MLEEELAFDRDLDKQRLTGEELDELIGEREYKELLKPGKKLYRKRNMKQKPPYAYRSRQTYGQRPQSDPTAFAHSWFTDYL